MVQCPTPDRQVRRALGWPRLNARRHLLCCIALTSGNYSDQRKSLQALSFLPLWHGSSPAPFLCGGGAARHFASVWHFHRGSHPESTWRKLDKETPVFQGLMKSRSGQAGFFGGIHLSQFAEAMCGCQPRRKPPRTSRLRCTFGPHPPSAAPVRRDLNTWPGGLPAGPCGRRRNRPTVVSGFPWRGRRTA